MYVRASEEYAKGNFTETAEILQKTGKFPPALLLRTKAEYFMGDLDNAEVSCRKTIKCRPTSYEAKLYLVKILRDKGEFKKAMEITETLLTDYPSDIRALQSASELSVLSGKNDDALIFLNKAVDYSAENALVLLNRARMNWVAGKGGEALDDIIRAKAMLPWETPLYRSINNLEKLIKEAI
jgi:tetratricopeptide (TPR) repeat protein